MGKSTTIYWRKAIIIVKTFWYYVKLVLFPKRLGLFHTYGYHQEEPMDHFDWNFFFGLFSIFIYCAVAFLNPGPVQFGLIWAVIYWVIFSNVITANQFVSERYIHTSIFGLSVVFAFLLNDYPFLLALILGICIMRVWVHLPTFQNEVRYYESNCFNFPNSEVAMGNLGVAYLNHGMPYKGYDSWLEGTRQNSLYDVPWYNLYSICKQNGDLISAKKFLMMCLNSKTIHFEEQWIKEMKELDSFLEKIKPQKSIFEVTQNINKNIKEGNYEFTRTL